MKSKKGEYNSFEEAFSHCREKGTPERCLVIHDNVREVIKIYPSGAYKTLAIQHTNISPTQPTPIGRLKSGEAVYVDAEDYILIEKDHSRLVEPKPEEWTEAIIIWAKSKYRLSDLHDSSESCAATL